MMRSSGLIDTHLPLSWSDASCLRAICAQSALEMPTSTCRCTAAVDDEVAVAGFALGHDGRSWHAERVATLDLQLPEAYMPGINSPLGLGRSIWAVSVRVCVPTDQEMRETLV